MHGARRRRRRAAAHGRVRPSPSFATDGQAYAFTVAGARRRRSRWWCREPPGLVSTDESTDKHRCRPIRPDPVADDPSPRVAVAGWRRSCSPSCAPGRAAGHVAARRRERPEHPEPAVAGLPHRRHRRRHRLRRRRLRRHQVPRPRPGDARADPRQAGARDRADDPPGRDPGRRRRPHRQHHLRAGQDRRHRVRRQRHRPAVVVGVRLPGAETAASAASPTPIVTSGQMVIPTEHQGRRSAAPAATSSTPSGSRSSTASATRCPAASTRCGCEADQPGIYAGQCTEFCGLSATPTCAWRSSRSTPPTSRPGTPTSSTPYTVARGRHAGRRRRGDVHRQCSRCHQVNGLRHDADGSTRCIANPDQYVVVRRGAEPDQPDDPQHLRRRHVGPAHPRRAATTCGTPRRRSSARCTCRASRRSASTRSTCASGCATHRRRSRCTPTPSKLETTDGKIRGMPNLALTEDQIDELDRLPARAEVTESD